MEPLRRLPHTRYSVSRTFVIFALLTAGGAAEAQTPPDPFGPGTGASTVLPAVTVTAPRALEAEPTDAASEKRISGETLNTRPVERPGEVLEAAPGLIVTQHSGEGKANQYFLRGINLDHGTDLAIWLDGMPINMRTHGHGQGYADINFLIPELVEQMIVKKGPYWAEEGDFASAGSLRLAYANRLERNVVLATGGSFGYWRGLAAGSMAFGQGALTAAGEVVFYDGPWQASDALRKFNAFLRYSEGTRGQRARHHRARLHQLLAFDRPDPGARRRPTAASAASARSTRPTAATPSAIRSVDALEPERRPRRQHSSRPTASTRR